MQAFRFMNNLTKVSKNMSQSKPQSVMNPNSPWKRVQQFMNKDDSALSISSRKPITVQAKRRMSRVMSTASVQKSKHGGKVKINQYIVEKTLGKGSFATVKLCRDSNTNEKFAVKQMNKKMLQKQKCAGGKSAYDCVVEELKVLKTLDHPNVIWLHEIIDDPNKDHIYLVTQFL